MPAAKLNFDFDTRKFSDVNGGIIQSFTGKKNSVREYELSIQQNGVSLTLPTGSTVTVALKKPGDPAGTLLTQAEAERVGWGTGSRWSYILDLSDDTAFTPVLGTSVDFEILMVLPDGQHIPSLTVPFKIEKNVQT
jgi:hypothetical protein